MSILRPPQYLNGLKSRPVTVSRSQLMASISSIYGTDSAQNRTIAESDYDPDYYMNTSKARRRWDKFRHRFHNSDTGEVFGRTWKQWLQLIGFFIVFYGVLALLFASCLGLFMFKFVMNDYPRLTGMQSVLKLNPGLGIIPQPDTWTSLIGFRISHRDSYGKYVDDIIAFSQWYEDYGQAAVRTASGKVNKDTTDNSYAKCPRSVEDSIKDTRRSCRQSLNFGGRCNIYQKFGYYDGMPCVLLKLNRVYGWMPDPLDNHTGVIVKCYGRSDYDKDLLGEICYHDINDFQGENLCTNDYGEFKSYFFPYLRQLSYQSPLVIIEFIRPARNVVIMIECRAYAKNIRYDPKTGEGAIRFELLVD